MRRRKSRGDSHWCFDIRKPYLEGSEHLKDDCLTIRCDVTVMKEIHGEEARVPPSDLQQHLGDLLKNQDAADLTFQAELLGAMEESSSGHMEICDMEADVFKSLLHFIYTDSVPPVLDVVMAGHLLVAADRYNIGRLRQICEEKLCNNIAANMVATSLALAEQHVFHDLKEACFQFLASPSNLEAMMASEGYEHLKSSCPSVLKELIARILPAEWNAAKDIVMTMWK
ncbi:hypothetical protein CFC21_068143 [Triticum aestivum]|uniref:BTB domain-containing protein n=2 Tax=Triticum aestivum TaxID=4565 RepID=A0A9R1KPC8_WHEAT|nr:hypothetical protein CFC21_068143 [Triticum aestivum]